MIVSISRRLLVKREASRCYLSHKVTASARIPSYTALLTNEFLNGIEKNVILRQHTNNVPLIRTLLKELELDDKNEEIARLLNIELDKLPNATHPRLLQYGTELKELMRIDAKNQHRKRPVEFSEVCKQMRLFRMEHLGNFTGHKSYYLKGALAELEQAICDFAVSALKSKNFRLISVPDILPSSYIEGCGMPTNGERTQVYKLDSGRCLSGTSEMALAGFFSDTVFDEVELPIRVAAVSRCFRAETSAVHEEKGIYRVHQFTKVEMFTVCSEAQSEQILETFKDIQVALFRELGLGFRLLDMPPFELGASAYQKYDIEAWLPGRNMWGEISSCSNCTDYQAKRLNIRYRTKEDQTLRFAHTVNGTAAAVPRLLIALTETNQINPDSISIPEPLRRFISKAEITKEKRVPELKLVKSIKSD